MYKAELVIFDKVYPILDFELILEKESDTTGLPVSNPYGGKMTIKFASSKNDTDILEAAMASRMMVKGYVRMYRRDGIQKLFDYEFANAYILLFNEAFDATSKNPVTTKVIIAPGILKKEDWIFTNYWNPSNPFLAAATPVSSTDEDEKKLTKYYLTDTGGTKIQDYKEGDIIVLNIETQNRVGDSVTVNLNDADYDFKHGDIDLHNDTLENYVIGNDLEQIELTVTAQKNNNS